MSMFRSTLVSEGSSDQALIPAIDWLLRQHVPADLQTTWADLRDLPNPPRDLDSKLLKAAQLYPCELLCIHRDGDREGRAPRVREIRRALSQAFPEKPQPAVCVIPVRSLESWFLFDETAIRMASSNPRGREALNLPPLRSLEALAKPRERLQECVRAASGPRRRRKREMTPHQALRRIAELTRDFTPLRELPTFRAFEDELVQTLQKHGWA
ncbi:MAG: hypothetical protein AAGF23_07110 [Acidobacteriota bacterium]